MNFYPIYFNFHVLKDGNHNRSLYYFYIGIKFKQGTGIEGYTFNPNTLESEADESL